MHTAGPSAEPVLAACSSDATSVAKPIAIPSGCAVAAAIAARLVHGPDVGCMRWHSSGGRAVLCRPRRLVLPRDAVLLAVPAELPARGLGLFQRCTTDGPSYTPSSISAIASLASSTATTVTAHRAPFSTTYTADRCKQLTAACVLFTTKLPSPLADVTSACATITYPSLAYPTFQIATTFAITLATTTAPLSASSRTCTAIAILIGISVSTSHLATDTCGWQLHGSNLGCMRRG